MDLVLLNLKQMNIVSCTTIRKCQYIVTCMYNVIFCQGGQHVIISERPGQGVIPEQESTGEGRPVPPRSEVQGRQG